MRTTRGWFYVSRSSLRRFVAVVERLATSAEIRSDSFAWPDPASPGRTHELHVIQVRRYESGASQPTLDVIRRLAVALQVSADVLIFGADERGPDGDLRLQFEAISKFAPEEKQVIKALLEGTSQTRSQTLVFSCLRGITLQVFA